MKHQIKHRYTDAVLFECDVPDDMESGLRTRHALEKAVESRANLIGANLIGANLIDANLSGANLIDANLSGANLIDAYLIDANLIDANLSGANLIGANLIGANLSGANLIGANLIGANLIGANLIGANLSGANLIDAYLIDAKWRDGITINIAPLLISGLHWMVYILDDHMQIGCELHTLSEWAAFDDARIVEMDGKDALRFWRNHKAALLALAASDGRGVKTESEAA